MPGLVSVLLLVFVVTAVAGLAPLHRCPRPRPVGVHRHRRVVRSRRPDVRAGPRRRAGPGAAAAALQLRPVQLAGGLPREPAGHRPATYLPRLSARVRRQGQYPTAWERLGNPSREPPTDAYRRLRMSMLRIEREVLVRERDSGTLDDDLLREAVRDLDYQESLLRRM